MDGVSMKKAQVPPIDQWEAELRSAADLGRRGRYSGAPSWVRDQTELLRDIATILGSIAGKLDALPPEVTLPTKRHRLRFWRR